MTEKVAILIPCYNEEQCVARVVTSFRSVLPNAEIWVFDNNSTDRTVEFARAAGALIGYQSLQGKGNVIRSMFARVQADYYIMVDGDATYDASIAPEMLDLLKSRDLDMVNAKRVENHQDSYRQGHRFGNWIFSQTIQFLFGDRISDLFSGYRAFSRRFVKSFPIESSGFQIETEITVYALELGLDIVEIPVEYSARPEGSSSKLSTYRDGFKISIAIAKLFIRAFAFRIFTALAFVALIISIACSSGLFAIVAVQLLSTGIILDYQAFALKSARKLAYLAQG